MDTPPLTNESDSAPTKPGASSNPDYKSKNQGGDNRNSEPRSKKVWSSMHQGYEYQGENTDIGVILALTNERFSNKVVFQCSLTK